MAEGSAGQGSELPGGRKGQQRWERVSGKGSDLKQSIMTCMCEDAVMKPMILHTNLKILIFKALWMLNPHLQKNISFAYNLYTLWGLVLISNSTQRSQRSGLDQAGLRRIGGRLFWLP